MPPRPRRDVKDHSVASEHLPTNIINHTIVAAIPVSVLIIV